MASARAPETASVNELMTAVKELSPAQLREFTSRLAEWQGQNGWQAQEKALIQRTKARLSPAKDLRLKRLSAKSERGTLTAKELEEYRTLAQKAEQINVSRVEALAELVRRWDKPLPVVKEIIGWGSAEDETPSHPARTAKTGARPRR